MLERCRNRMDLLYIIFSVDGGVGGQGGVGERGGFLHSSGKAPRKK